MQRGTINSFIGFTLAEVLITLGIIGIVAAMTLPTLVNNHRKKVLHTQFLKTYSDLNNAAKLFQVYEGQTVFEYSSKGVSSTDALKKFMSYFKGSKNGNIQTGSYTEEDEANASGNVNYKSAIGFSPKNLNGKDLYTHSCDQSIVSEEVEGRLYAMDDPVTLYANPSNGPKICVDINGRKTPNRYGYDWFVFVFTKEGLVKPYIGNSQNGLGENMPNPEARCSYNYTQVTYTCAHFALQDVSPLDPSKKYWTDFLK